jgi:hypothetical protein
MIMSNYCLTYYLTYDMVFCGINLQLAAHEPTFRREKSFVNKLNVILVQVRQHRYCTIISPLYHHYITVISLSFQDRDKIFTA